MLKRFSWNKNKNNNNNENENEKYLNKYMMFIYEQFNEQNSNTEIPDVIRIDVVNKIKEHANNFFKDKNAKDLIKEMTGIGNYTKAEEENLVKLFKEDGPKKLEKANKIRNEINMLFNNFNNFEFKKELFNENYINKNLAGKSVLQYMKQLIARILTNETGWMLQMDNEFSTATANGGKRRKRRKTRRRRKSKKSRKSRRKSKKSRRRRRRTRRR